MILYTSGGEEAWPIYSVTKEPRNCYDTELILSDEDAEFIIKAEEDFYKAQKLLDAAFKAVSKKAEMLG